MRHELHLSTVTGVGVVARTGAEARVVKGAASVYELASAAITAGHGLAAEVALRGFGQTVDLARASFALPVSHPDPAHLHLTGTCAGCPGATMTRERLLEPAVRGAAPKATVRVTTGWRVPEGARRVE